MTQTVIQYEIYLPLQYNDGTWIEKEKYNYVHHVIIYTVIDFNLDAGNSRFFGELKEELKGLFRQKEILITGVEVTVF